MKCIICKQPYEQNNNFPKNNACQNCQFWVENLMWDRQRDFAVIDRQHYVIGKKLENYTADAGDTLLGIATSFQSAGDNKLKGMGGAKHIIKFFDGRVVITDDLWHQGTIPESFSDTDAFGNNAEFVS